MGLSGISLTRIDAMARKSSLLHAAGNAISLTNALAHAAMSLSRICTKITAPKARSSAKYAPRHSPRKKTGVRSRTHSGALTAPMPFRRRNESSSSSTNTAIISSLKSPGLSACPMAMKSQKSSAHTNRSLNG